MPLHRLLFIIAALTVFSSMSYSQEKPVVLYDESLLPKYQLPDVLVASDGTEIKTAKQWSEIRRPEIVKLFESEVYGKAPPKPSSLVFDVTEPATEALDGMAVRKQVSVQLTESAAGPHLDLLIYLPKSAKGPVPVFFGLNFYGNQSIHADPGIHITKSWVRNNSSKGTENHQATEASRGTSSSRWPVEMILDRGYGLVAAYYGDIDPDFNDDFENGVHAVYDQQQKRPADAWGSIAAWAWGLSRGMDYLEKDEIVDGQQVILLGHSRLGKTALWGGAVEPRYAAVISNNSGCGGAALSRRRYGESVRRINTAFPHWFCDNYSKYNDNENACPVDQHMLISLIAPRPTFVCSAEDDRWADPRGEFLATLYANPVFELLNVEGLAATEMPAVNEPILSRLAYSIRTGKHDVLESDWQRYIQFADRNVTHFSKRD